MGIASVQDDGEGEQHGVEVAIRGDGHLLEALVEMVGHTEEVLEFALGLSFGIGKVHASADEFLDAGFGNVRQHVDVDRLFIVEVGNGLQSDLGGRQLADYFVVIESVAGEQGQVRFHLDVAEVEGTVVGGDGGGERLSGLSEACVELVDGDGGSSHERTFLHLAGEGKGAAGLFFGARGEGQHSDECKTQS